MGEYIPCTNKCEVREKIQKERGMEYWDKHGCERDETCPFLKLQDASFQLSEILNALMFLEEDFHGPADVEKLQGWVIETRKEIEEMLGDLEDRMENMEVKA